MRRDVATDDDSDLLRRARIGDRPAFDAIVRAHQSAALGLAAVVGGDATEAGDIVQEAFVRADGQLHTVRDGDALRPWLLRIVGIAAGPVKSRPARALGRLRTRLDEEGGS